MVSGRTHRLQHLGKSSGYGEWLMLTGRRKELTTQLTDQIQRVRKFARIGLNPDERIRYSRQLKVPEFGEEGQKKLRASHVLIAGVGGLGCASATALTAAGVGRITRVA